MSALSDQFWAASREGPAASDDRWNLAVRVGESPQFQKSPRLRDFLFYICEKCIQNSPEDLKEYHIGFRVFNKPNYNPAEDNIVRVEARLLRKRLEEYFEKDGKDEPLIIRIPKGSYVPVFEQRAAPEAGPLDGTQPVAEPFASIQSLVSPAQAIPTTGVDAGAAVLIHRWIWPAIAVLLAILCVAGWTRTDPRSVVTDHSNRTAPLWSIVFNTESDTSIVCADSALVLLQDITHRPVTLAEYANRDYMGKTGKLGPDMESVVRLLPGKFYTSIADLQLVDRLQRLNSFNWGRTSVRSARNVNATDFKSGNFVLLGSSRANPWVSLFEPQLNFAIQYDDKLQEKSVENRFPKAGEQAVYRPAPTSGNDQDAFSVIALVPNLTHTGEVLIIAGTSMQGTEAAGEFLTDRTQCGKLFQAMGASSRGKVPHFEALLRSGTLAGTAKGSELIAYRLLAS